jgi:hypothetical protein
MDLTFDASESFNTGVVEIEGLGEEFVDLKQFWGDNFSYDDFTFLERELSEWKKTHKCDTKAEISLLKELCYKELEIRKKRMENAGSGTSALVKEKQELMKTASVDPAKTSLASSGKNFDILSEKIKIMEVTDPADYFSDKDLFSDYDDIDWYYQKYHVRPAKNFITNSRDFNVDKDDYDNIKDEDEIITLESLTNGSSI